jgi:hypothetical protein
MVLTLGSGDNLPANLTQVTVTKGVAQALVMTGSNVTGIAMTSPGHAALTFLSSAPATIGYAEADAGDSYIWLTGSGATSPVSGGSVVSVRASTGEITAQVVTASIIRS